MAHVIRNGINTKDKSKMEYKNSLRFRVGPLKSMANIFQGKKLRDDIFSAILAAKGMKLSQN